MKNLTTFLIAFLIAFSIQIKAQSNNDENGYYKHASAGLMIGFTTSTAGYVILSKTTNLHPTWCKIIANVASLGVSYYSGKMWEQHSGGVYNENDIKYTTYGGITGTLIGGAITFPSISKRWLRKKNRDIEKEFDFNPPLAKQ